MQHCPAPLKKFLYGQKSALHGIFEGNIHGFARFERIQHQSVYFAEKGNGAFKEGSRSHERLRVSSRKEAADAVIGVSEYMPAYAALAAVRMQGSPVLDLAFVASGKLDAAVISGSAAEFAAGMLLVKEAGGYVYDANQKDIRTENLAAVLDSGKCLAVNAELGRRMHDLINN